MLIYTQDNFLLAILKKTCIINEIYLTNETKIKINVKK
jgi:hypothetical protein